jgi:hypothetical protein
MINSNRTRIATKPTETVVSFLLLRGGQFSTHEHPEAFLAASAEYERGLSTNRSRQ